MVELFSILLDHPRIEAASTRGPHVRTPLGIRAGGESMPSEDQVRALVLADGARVSRTDLDGDREVIDPVEIVLVSYSDIHGTDADAANLRALARLPGVTIVRSIGDRGARAQVRLGELSAFITTEDTSRDRSSEAIRRLDQVVDAMTTTLEELYIDDSTHVEYLIELAEAAWDAWIRLDLPSELRQLARDLDIAVPDDARSPDGGRYDAGDLDGIDRYVDDLFGVYEDKVRAAYYDYEGNEWVAETATSVINARHGHAVRYAAHMVFGWPALP
ncbi:hypothetical protein [Actinophytocola sp.]|uniref:hypothetical protein n=1 Tax=Actinophytocola sp. TaxID=1872138 RepID=UPI00389A59D6